MSLAIGSDFAHKGENEERGSENPPSSFSSREVPELIRSVRPVPGRG